MFFGETKETEEGIRRMFHQVREKMRQRITLKKKSDPGKFVVPCLVGGIDYPSALCDTGSAVNILPKVMADHLGLKIEPTEDSFTFVDCFRRTQEDSSDLEVKIGSPSFSRLPLYGHQAQLELFSITWESLHGYCRSSMRHADQQVVPDTHRPYCLL